MSKQLAQRSDGKKDDYMPKLRKRIDNERKELMGLLAEKEQEM